ncbi:MAG: hypothetical protein A3F31_00625 [Candidatus Levybacteria bacterium RIFCSPHIGHO2_12_FULL_38_12]|nr:MAG: hypothetical protein A2770_02920 [Candidatus Levybacteria bacterium RIFCSPHIGHO2_01_FULL_38_12]OGH22768.1 MAG: hypothetical protein A3F31_00625 [Candidatus Levybacteria bacterium RIFCSPHIGHO2_12_FULL_38_12]OGH45021.1 MAG: hypothetical protein A3J14_04060 [Candidatus Levybacteria bacterium RIFCSPLOWO2_02_FULL_37_18]OGH51804.1 MAG: hypothetical protein A3G13_03315 [Candidatus Levybacteria bacterium RIFCSPLOWO2_12_FULL_37_7]
MKSAKYTSNVSVAFAPANISCFFTVRPHPDPRWMGSTGLGFTLDKGVVAEVSKIFKSSRQARTLKSEVFFNGKKIKFPTVLSVIKMLTAETIIVWISSELSLGHGFGLSGASAIAVAYALNKLLKLKKTKKELAIIAHTAEVKNKTGLGDVVNQYFGGFFLKTKPSSRFLVKRISLPEKYVYIRHLSPIQTKSILTNKKLVGRINNAGERAIRKIKQLNIGMANEIHFSDIIDISKEFAKQSGLLKDRQTKKTIEQIEKNNNHASMIILGNGVFSNKPFAGSKKFTISNRKAEVL